jgi:type IV secretory pathway TraG/TraD family ATPase VirD4
LLTTEQIVDVLKSDIKALSIASSVQEAVEKDAGEQVAGVIATLKSQTQKLDNENFFWVLSGNDVDLNLNDPESPQLLCLVNDQQKEETITPVISLIVTVARKLMNTKHRQKSIFLLDEAPTLFLPNFDTLPATGRSNKICACVMCQDISQMDSMYEKVGREKILGSLGNTFYGNCSSYPTQEYISKSFGKVDKIIENQTQGRNKSTGSHGQSDSLSYNVQERELIKPSDVGAFEIGEFCGKIIGKDNTYYRTRFDILENE